jgi:hypothetical protein
MLAALYFGAAVSHGFVSLATETRARLEGKMETRQDLEKKVQRLEREVAALQGGGCAVRKRSSTRLGDLPLYEVALGPDPARGESRGHAKAILAVGDMATGFVAIGGWARGVIALGGLATGLVSFGGMSVGVLFAVGGLAIGGVALGGGAAGEVAVGGAAVGHYACGGAAVGHHVISPMRRDPAAEAFFEKYGLGAVVGTRGGQAALR